MRPSSMQAGMQAIVLQLLPVAAAHDLAAEGVLRGWPGGVKIMVGVIRVPPQPCPTAAICK